MKKPLNRPQVMETVADLRRCINVLPRISHELGDMMDQHRQHRAAAERLGRYLGETYGARIAERPEITRITMHGISASSTGGMHAAFRNWVAAAERKLSEAEQ